MSVRRRFGKPPLPVPTSHSVLTSGLRSGLPRLLGTSPGPSPEEYALKVVYLSNAPGCRPDCPSAARRRNVDSFDVRGPLSQPGMALGMTDRLTLGWNTPADVLPQALFRSYRPPTVQNTWSRHP